MQESVVRTNEERMTRRIVDSFAGDRESARRVGV
jgi:hypothetical protein